MISDGKMLHRGKCTLRAAFFFLIKRELRNSLFSLLFFFDHFLFFCGIDHSESI